MDYSLANVSRDEMSTKEKIMISALELFCQKGYSETSIRDIATAVGITAGSIYGHFTSKEEMLLFMLDDYAERTRDLFRSLDIEPILKENPTGEGITACILKSISTLTDNAYYANLVHLIHQEQHRMSLFGGYVLLRLSDTQEFIGRVFDILKAMNVIKADSDPEYWGFYAYSIMYLIPTCQALQRSQNTTGYGVKDLSPMLCYLFNIMLEVNKL
ncbi:MAG: TetR/AcrR family transcriptional regulator [Oscillospiraceae bacterium]|nr:TetR/AcrR family transcriptional regulator [Oscillospiraceae bacterium]